MTKKTDPKKTKPPEPQKSAPTAKKPAAAPEKKKRTAVCGTCNKPGHNARTCGR